MGDEDDTGKGWERKSESEKRRCVYVCVYVCVCACVCVRGVFAVWQAEHECGRHGWHPQEGSMDRMVPTLSRMLTDTMATSSLVESTGWACSSTSKTTHVRRREKGKRGRDRGAGFALKSPLG